MTSRSCPETTPTGRSSRSVSDTASPSSDSGLVHYVATVAEIEFDNLVTKEHL